MQLNPSAVRSAPCAGDGLGSLGEGWQGGNCGDLLGGGVRDAEGWGKDGDDGHSVMD